MRKIFELLTARTQAGITARLWMAVLMSVAALLVNFFYIRPEYDVLPPIVPISFDMFGEIEEWGAKHIVYDYAEIRAVFFVIMLVIGYVIGRTGDGSLLRKRMRLLVVDIANLIITTVVNMTLVYIQIANGDNSEKLSEHLEFAVMLFWLLILVVEYKKDIPYLKK